MIQMKVKLQPGNTKLGKCLNVSLPPCKSCDTSMPCFKSGCYGQKFYGLRENCRAAWENNWRMVSAHRPEYFAQIVAALERRRSTSLFRWHVAGDIPDFDYLERMWGVAEAYPGVKFLCFTKKYDLLKLAPKKFGGMLPRNLSIVASAWPGVTMPHIVRRNFPVAWVRDPKDPDPRIPKDTHECDGGCDRCGLCWNLPAGQSICFNKH